VLRFLCALVAAGCAAQRGLVPENRIACSGPHTLADSANGRLQGRVTDALDDRPLAGIEVSIGAADGVRATTTDVHGEWRIGNLPEGEYRVLLHHSGRRLYSSVLHLCSEDVLTLRTPVRR
jgi:hypothetical protein